MNIADAKIYEPETIKEEPLPESVLWESVIDHPTSLAQLSPADGAALSAATTATTGLGDLAYKDLVAELDIAAGAVTNAKIAVSAIQGAVIAAGAITATKISDGAIETNKLAANAVTAAKIAAGTITATEIAAGTITADRIQSGTITAAQIASGSITVDRLTAGNLVGFTIATGTSGQRVVLTSTLAQFYNSSGTEIAETFASGSSYLIKGMQSTSSIFLEPGSSGTVAFVYSGSAKMIIDPANSRFTPATNGGASLGYPGGNWSDIYNNGAHTYQGTDQPIVYWGRIVSGSFDTGNGSWGVSSLGTGRYRITHSLNHTGYAAIVSAIRGSGAGAYSSKIEAYSSTTVDVTIFDDAGTAVASDFMLTLFESPV